MIDAGPLKEQVTGVGDGVGEGVGDGDGDGVGEGVGDGPGSFGAPAAIHALRIFAWSGVSGPPALAGGIVFKVSAWFWISAKWPKTEA
jgi:hypothetical protein